MAKTCIRTAILLLSCFDVAQFTSYKCVDERCSEAANKVRIEVDFTPFKDEQKIAKRGEQLLLYGRSLDDTECLVNKKQGEKLFLFPCNVLKNMSQPKNLTTITTYDVRETVKSSVSTGSSLGEQTVVSSKYEEDLNYNTSSSLSATSENVTETRSKFEKLPLTSGNTSQKLHENLNKDTIDTPNLDASFDSSLGKQTVVSSKYEQDLNYNTSSSLSATSENVTETRSKFEKLPLTSENTSQKSLENLNKDTVDTPNLDASVDSSPGKQTVVSSKYEQDLNYNTSSSLSATSENVTETESKFEKLPSTSGNTSQKLHENLNKGIIDTPTLDASFDMKMNETLLKRQHLKNANLVESQNRTLNVSAFSKPSSAAKEVNKPNFIRKPTSTIKSSPRSWKQSDWKLKYFLEVVLFQSSLEQKVTETSRSVKVDIVDSIGSFEMDDANSPNNNGSEKSEGDHVTEKFSKIKGIETISSPLKETPQVKPINNETENENQEISRVLNYDIQKEQVQVDNRSNETVDNGISLQGVKMNDKLNHSRSYDQNSTDILDTKVALAEASNGAKYEHIPLSPPSTKPAIEATQNISSHDIHNEQKTAVPNSLENLKFDDPSSTTDTNSSTMKIRENEHIMSDDVAVSSETTLDKKVLESVPKVLSIEGDGDTSDFYELIRNKKMKKIDPIPSENPNIDQSFLFSDKILDYIPDSSSIMLCFDKMKNTVNSFWHWEKTDISSNEYCTTESDCDSRSVSPTHKADDSIGFVSFVMGFPFEELHSKNFKTISVCFMSIVFFIVFTIFYLILNSKNKKKVNSLTTIINQLEKKLFVAKKEIALLNEKLVCCDLEDQVQDTVEVEANSATIATLEGQVQRLQRENTDLEDRVVYLERELENVSTSALEMHKLLENSLSTQVSSKIAEDEVESLKTLTEKQENQIEDLIREMDLIVTENQCLKDELKKMQKENSSQVKKNLELTEKLRNLKLRFDLQIESHNLQSNNYKSEIDKLLSKLEDTEMNLKRSEFQIAELNRAYVMKEEGENDSTSRSSAIDHSQLRVQLATLKAMNNELLNELKEQKKARRTLDEHVGDVIRELNDVKKSNEMTEKERNEAVTKLHVLTDYFKDKESQLHKELEEKDKLFSENEYKDQLLSQKLSSLKEEIENQKRRNEELRKEIEDQENSFKIQLANAEEKTRDHWFMLRQAERKYQESEKESATLRNRMLILETTLSGVNQKLNEKTNLNGDVSPIPVLYHSTTSPDLLPYRNSTEMIPTPSSPIASHSLEFFPPAPSYSTDERLPPLGGRRVPSPPMSVDDYDDFEPPPPNFQYMSGRNRHEQLPMSPSFVPPPPPSINRHRSQYEGFDSPSSGVSVESLDKSGR